MSKLSDINVCRIIRDHLDIYTVDARWVPKHLSVVKEQSRVKCVPSFLELRGADPNLVWKPLTPTMKLCLLTIFFYIIKKELRRKGDPPPHENLVCHQQKRWWLQSIGIAILHNPFKINQKDSYSAVNGPNYIAVLHKLGKNMRKIIERRAIIAR